MMKIFNPVAFLFMTLGIVFITVFQFLKNDHLELDHISKTSQIALEIKQLDVSLNENALKAAHFKLLHFDKIVQDVAHLRQKLDLLEKNIEALPSITGYDLAPQFSALKASLSNRINFVEKLKSAVALARNSSNFLLTSLTAEPENNLDVLALIALNEIQAFKTYPSDQRLEKTKAALADYSAQIEGPILEERHPNLLRHMEISLEATQDIDVFLQELTQTKSLLQINEMIMGISDISIAHQDRSTALSFALLVLAVLIFVAFAYVLMRWNQARDKTLRHSEMFKEAVESMTEGFAFFNPQGKLAFANSKFKSIYKYFDSEIRPGLDIEDFHKLQEQSNLVIKAVEQNDGSILENHRDGKWVLRSTHAMQTGGQTLVHVDITEQKQAEHDLRLAATVFDNAGEAIMVTDKENIICMINSAFSEITGYSEAEILGKTPKFLNSGRHPQSFFEDMYAQLKSTGKWSGEIWNKRKNGEIYPEWLSITSIMSPSGELRQRVAMFTDITNRKKTEERIYHQANFNAITDLPNRNLFIDRFNQSIFKAERDQCRVALMYLDLDNFKNINDTFGHKTGDNLLREVGARLHSLIRGADTVAHISGDEFAIIFNEFERNFELEKAMTSILESLSEPFVINGTTTYTSMSIGITSYPDDGETADVLMQNADTAMFMAKDQGRNTYCFFTPEMNQRAQERHDMEIALHDALDEEQFILHYQPIVDPVSLTVISTECLVRWNDPIHGMVSPAKFIPVAEDTGLIVPIGEWILKQACLDAADWIKNKGLNVGVSVNLSSRQFGRCNMVELVEHTLIESGLPANKLTLEITESLLVDDDEEVLNTLRKIRDMGVLLSIDDFGTGYSSLSYLKKFPLTTLKIDQSFISGVLDNSEDAALTEAILSIADSLKLKVVAEGVENSGQAAFLLERQCNLIQGYYYSKPLPVGDLLKAFSSKKLVA